VQEEKMSVPEEMPTELIAKSPSTTHATLHQHEKIN